MKGEGENQEYVTCYELGKADGILHRNCWGVKRGWLANV
jgi:hypothetical protein